MKKINFLLWSIFLSSPLSAQADRMQDIQKSMIQNFADCLYVGHVYKPNDIQGTHQGLCIHQVSSLQGLFPAKACVVTFIEPETRTRDPYYKKDGHWGIEGDCDPKRIVKKLQEEQTFTTQNPITRLLDLRDKGWTYKTLKEYGKTSTTIKSILKNK